ncbi:MAG: AraC family transcriptional regulator [Solirubrobacteraceae bacterium]|nr:AraC family transcriptional regulator [Patulibacter sp.]
MDALAGLLDGPRARGAFVLRALMSPPWSMRIEDHAPLSVFVVVRGHAWVVPDDGTPVLAEAGAVVVVRGPQPYTVAHDPASPPHVLIDEQQQCFTLDGTPLMQSMDLGVRAWGNDRHGAADLLVATYTDPGAVGRRVLSTLPHVIVLPADAWDGALVPLLRSEIAKDEPGQEAVLDRLVDLLLVGALRAWFARPDGEAPGWYRAQADPVVGQAIRLLHHSPERPWTVGSLAHEVGLSRAALARRFHEVVGEPPMAYLTQWRLTLAADLLHEPGSTIESVAQLVGYGSAFALSTAFKRVRGVSPREHRAAARRGAGGLDHAAPQRTADDTRAAA